MQKKEFALMRAHHTITILIKLIFLLTSTLTFAMGRVVNVSADNPSGKKTIKEMHAAEKNKIEINTPVQYATELIIQKDKVFDPEKLSLDSIVLYEKKFAFDWTKPETQTPHKAKLPEIATFIKMTKLEDLQKLTAAEREALGRILYRAGTYYTDISHEPDLAITHLTLAEKMLAKKEDKLWAYNHLSYAYEIKFANTHQEAFRDKSNYFSDQVITQVKNDSKTLAFAYNIKGLLESDQKNYGNAEKNFLVAISIYEKIPNGKDDQYARVRNRLASTILAMNDRDNEAITVFQELKLYWQKKGNADKSPYAARNMLSLGQAYLKMGNIKEAMTELNNAIEIYKKVYGNLSELLIKPYQALSAAYEQLGDEKLVNAYEEKASSLDSLLTSMR